MSPYEILYAAVVANSESLTLQEVTDYSVVVDRLDGNGPRLDAWKGPESIASTFVDTYLI